MNVGEQGWSRNTRHSFRQVRQGHGAVKQAATYGQ